MAPRIQLSLPPLCWNYKHKPPHLAFLCGFCGWNFGLHVSAANTLMIKSSPQLLALCLNVPFLHVYSIWHRLYFFLVLVTLPNKGHLHRYWQLGHQHVIVGNTVLSIRNSLISSSSYTSCFLPRYFEGDIHCNKWHKLEIPCVVTKDSSSPGRNVLPSDAVRDDMMLWQRKD